MRNFWAEVSSLRMGRSWNWSSARKTRAASAPSTNWSRRPIARLLRRDPAGQGNDQEVRGVLPAPRPHVARSELLDSLRANIPRQVGLAGSSAIIVATLRCLMDFYNRIPRRVQPSLALSVETEELGIAAGLQDRVVQVYEGLVAMDFGQDRMQTVDGFECGIYQPLDPNLLPPIYVAFRDDVSEPTEVVHNNLRIRYNSGESSVVEAMEGFAALTDQARTALEQHDAAALAAAIDANFDLRQSICQLHPGHVEMIEAAQSAGASAKFAGSGGAIVGTFETPEMLLRLKKALGDIGCCVFQPRITNQCSFPEWLGDHR